MYHRGHYATESVSRVGTDVESQKASKKQALLANKLKSIDEECKHLLKCEPE